jgi:hypothetical protein
MASPESTALSRCRYENRIVEHKTNIPRELQTLGPTDVVDVERFSANGNNGRQKTFLSCGIPTNQLSFSSIGQPLLVSFVGPSGSSKYTRQT